MYFYYLCLMIKSIINFFTGYDPGNKAEQVSFTTKELLRFLLWTAAATLFTVLTGMYYLAFLGAFGCLYLLYEIVAKLLNN